MMYRVRGFAIPFPDRDIGLSGVKLGGGVGPPHRVEPLKYSDPPSVGNHPTGRLGGRAGTTIFKAALLFPSKFSFPKKNTRRAPSFVPLSSIPPRSPLTASVVRRQFFIHPPSSTRGSRALRTCANAPSPAHSPSLAAIRVSQTNASSSLFDSTPHSPHFSHLHT